MIGLYNIWDQIKMAIGTCLNNAKFRILNAIFWSAYIIVALIGILHTILNIYVLHIKPMDKESMGEGYEKTKPWHP